MLDEEEFLSPYGIRALSRYHAKHPYIFNVGGQAYRVNYLPAESRIFLRDQSGRRPVYGGTEKFQTDPHWKDYILFYEYFHGDNGAGLGASHQTGWTGLVARLMQIFGRIDGTQLLAGGKVGAFTKADPNKSKVVAA